MFPLALPVLIYEDALVFKDLSTLFVSGSGLLCFVLPTGAATESVDVEVIGGTGQLAGATGQLQVDFPEIFSTFLEYAVASGTVTGTLTLQ